MGSSRVLAWSTSDKDYEGYEHNEDYGANQIVISRRVCARMGISCYLTGNSCRDVLINLVEQETGFHGVFLLWGFVDAADNAAIRVVNIIRAVYFVFVNFNVVEFH